MLTEEEYIAVLYKLAKGFEYEETQTLIEETKIGQKKKIVKVKKYKAPEIEALKILRRINNGYKVNKNQVKKIKKEIDKWKL